MNSCSLSHQSWDLNCIGPALPVCGPVHSDVTASQLAWLSLFLSVALYIRLSVGVLGSAEPVNIQDISIELSYAQAASECHVMSSLTDHDRTQIPQRAQTLARTRVTPMALGGWGRLGVGVWHGVCLARCALVACVNFSLKFK